METAAATKAIRGAERWIDVSIVAFRWFARELRDKETLIEQCVQTLRAAMEQRKGILLRLTVKV